MLDMLSSATGGNALRAATCLFLVSVMTGCASWHVVDQSPQQVFASERPDRVRVTTNDGAQTVLRQPRVLGDVLAGFDDTCFGEFGLDVNCEERGIAVFEIAVLEVRRRGLAAIVLPAVGGLLGVWLLANR